MPTYSVDVDDRLLANDFPKIARAVHVIRERMAFRGPVTVTLLRKKRAGEYSYAHQTISFATFVEAQEWTKVIEIAVHEAIHSLGVHHQDNFRSHGGLHCVHGYDTLSHCVAAILEGNESFSNMKFLHQHIGAYSKKLLRQIAMVEAILRTQYKIENALGDCKIADLTDPRMYRWQQMTPEQKRRQVNKMKIGRMKKLGWDIKVSGCHEAPASYNGRSFSWMCTDCYRECDVRDA